jgi:hypothetical protein
MAALDPAAFGKIVAASKLVGEYAADVDPAAAKEMLTARMQQAQVQAQASAQVAGTAAYIEKRYAKQQESVQQAYERAQEEAARAEARDEARAYARDHRYESRYGGGSGGSADGTDWEEAAKIGAEVLASPAANTLLRGIFGTLTGPPARRVRRR